MIPGPIYAVLPYIYLITGVMALVGIESIFGKICGLLLVIIGVVIHQARRRYRHRKIQLETDNKKVQGNSHRQTNPNHSDNTSRYNNTQRSRSNRAATDHYNGIKALRHFENGEDSYERGDYAAALKHYQKAAELGYAPAQVNLGSMFFEGQGVPRDFDEALKWYRIAANQGYVSAQFNLGMLHEQSDGVLQDFEQAMRWYHRAAEQGHAPAQVNLGSMYFEGRGVPRNFQEALRWYHQAAEQGHAPAQFNLGVIYAEGKAEIAKDPVKAHVWFSRAAVLGDEDAQRERAKIAVRLTAAQKTQAQELLRTPCQVYTT